MKKGILAILVFLFIGVKSVFAVEDTTQFNLRVMFVKLSPVENGEDMIGHFFGWQFSGKTSDQALDLGINANINAFKRLSNSKINYQVVKRLNITTFPKYTNGFNYNFASYLKCTNGTDTAGECEKQKYYFDYIDWARSNNICQLASENNIDEIWMASPPYIATWENFMMGPRDGFDVNGPAFVLSECIKNYVVMSSDWTVKSFAHTYGHRVERTMEYIMQNWKNDDKNKYWENFAVLSLYNQSYGPGTTMAPRAPFCGNSHFPHNVVRPYDTGNKTYKDSTCRDWKNIPNFTGYKENINCDGWYCTDNGVSGWGEYWMGSMPREQGSLNLVSNSGISFIMKNNWWYYLLYPENAITLVKDTRVAPTATPTPIPKTCSIGALTVGSENISGTFSGKGNGSGTENVRLFLEKSDGTLLVSTPGGVISQGCWDTCSYKIGECNSTNSVTCNGNFSVTKIPAGSYYLHCDLPTDPPSKKCSGNPFCNFENPPMPGGFDCASTGWISCSNSDNYSFTIGIPTATITPNPKPTSTPFPTLTLVPTITVVPTKIPTTVLVTPTSTPTLVPTPTLTPAPLPGDANEDGKVDELDYQIWLSNFGQSVSLGPTRGDFNNDGVVDGVDYNIWLVNYSN